MDYSLYIYKIIRRYKLYDLSILPSGNCMFKIDMFDYTISLISIDSRYFLEIKTFFNDFGKYIFTWPGIYEDFLHIVDDFGISERSYINIFMFDRKKDFFKTILRYIMNKKRHMISIRYKLK